MDMRYFNIKGLSSNCFREDKLVEHAKALKVNAGTDPAADLGPVISKQVHPWFIILSVHYWMSFANCGFNFIYIYIYIFVLHFVSSL